MGPEKFDVVIIGAGFAGAATAFHLSEIFRGSILIIEREQVPGVHASGRNAGLILQSVSDPAIRSTVAAGAREYARLRSELGFRQTGSLLLGPRDRLAGIRDTDRVESSLHDADAVRRRHPVDFAGRPRLSHVRPGGQQHDIAHTPCRMRIEPVGQGNLRSVVAVDVPTIGIERPGHVRRQHVPRPRRVLEPRQFGRPFIDRDQVLLSIGVQVGGQITFACVLWISYPAGSFVPETAVKTKEG